MQKAWLALCLSTMVWAQTAPATKKTHRIGYTNIELVLSYMPEAQEVEAQLRTYEKKIMEQLNIKQAYLQTKIEEYTELKQQGKLSPVQEEERRKEIMRLDEELKRFQEESEQNYFKKKADLLQPIIDKLQKAINELAEAEGYDYILNNSNTSGVATVLYGPKSEDVTERLLRRLGIDPSKLERPTSTGSSSTSGGMVPTTGTAGTGKK